MTLIYFIYIYIYIIAGAISVFFFSPRLLSQKCSFAPTNKEHFLKCRLKWRPGLTYLPFVLVETKEEKDLGVYITPDLKSATHVAKVAAKANSMIGRIRHTFKFMNTNIFKSIYPGLVRSHMEYAVQVWSPHLKKDIKTLEKVQRRAFNIVPELRGLTYEQQLTELGLTTLEERRRRGDLIEVFKIMHGYENLDRSYFFVLESEVHGYATRRHGLSIKTPTTVTKRRKKFFDIRIINDWNRLPASVVYSRSIGSFKRALDDYYSVQEATSN